tara:strand:- start:15 stop:221 length:207 start_codon:yes stop_codon:yes gene_type:complete
MGWLKSKKWDRATSLAQVFFLYKSPSMFYVWFITKGENNARTLRKKETNEKEWGFEGETKELTYCIKE